MLAKLQGRQVSRSRNSRYNEFGGCNHFEQIVVVLFSIGKLRRTAPLTNGHLLGRCCTGYSLLFVGDSSPRSATLQLTFPINNRLNNPLSTPSCSHSSEPTAEQSCVPRVAHLDLSLPYGSQETRTDNNQFDLFIEEILMNGRVAVSVIVQ